MGNQIILPNWVVTGTWLIEYYLVGTAATITAPGITVQGGALSAPTVGFGATTVVPANGVSSSEIYVSVMIDVNEGEGAGITLSTGGVYPTSPTGGFVRVTQVFNATGGWPLVASDQD